MSRDYRFAYQQMRHYERKSRFLIRCAARNEQSAHSHHRACAVLNEREADHCDDMAADYRRGLGL